MPDVLPVVDFMQAIRRAQRVAVTALAPGRYEAVVLVCPQRVKRNLEKAFRNQHVVASML
jgi:hypothetical protein